jgi:hypothetical protein
VTPLNKELYTQFYDKTTSSFVEQKLTGIFFQFTTGNLDATILNDRTFFSGLSIPVFKTERIVTFPVAVGNSLTVDGPAVNIGSYNSTWSPSIIRGLYNWGPEIAIGSSNFLVSGVGNISIGHLNSLGRTARIHSVGTYNDIDQSVYSSIIGNYNKLSGYSESNVFGKNNYLYSNNNIRGILSKPGVSPAVFSGYTSYKVSVFGDNNSLFEGASEVTLLGNYNQFTDSSGVACFGNSNNINRTINGNTYVIGYNNDCTRGFNIYTLGDSNVSELANSDLVIGRSNYTTGTYLSYVFGQLNTLKNCNNNIAFGNSNTILSSNNSVFGNLNTIDATTDENTIIGSNNTVDDSANDNFIFGAQNSSDAALRTELATKHAFLTNRLSASAGSSNYYMGQLVRGTDNSSTHGLGINNKLAGNLESLLIGRNNEFVLNNNSFAFGYNNRITGSKDSIFVGFNFISGSSAEGIKGVGIKITPNGIDIYGTLRVNGTTMNVP